MFQSSIPVTGTCDSAAAMSGILRGKCEEIDSSSPCSSVQESDDEVFSCDSADSVDSVNPSTSNHFTGEYLKLYSGYTPSCVIWSILSFCLYLLAYFCSKIFHPARLICKTYHFGQLSLS